MMLDSRRYMA